MKPVYVSISTLICCYISLGTPAFSPIINHAQNHNSQDKTLQNFQNIIVRMSQQVLDSDMKILSNRKIQEKTRETVLTFYIAMISHHFDEFFCQIDRKRPKNYLK